MKDDKGRFIKGSSPWNKGLKGLHFSPATEFKKGGPVDEKHPGWKGSEVKYSGIHMWIRRKLGIPGKCDDCGKEDARRYEWANISGQYLREFTDWKRLCKSCHNRFDNVNYKAWQTRRAVL